MSVPAVNRKVSDDRPCQVCGLVRRVHYARGTKVCVACRKYVDAGPLDESWKTDAKCRDGYYSPEVWFPDPGDVKGIAFAVALCEMCPSKAPCLEFARKRGEAFGIWGGEFMEKRNQFPSNSKGVA